MACTIWNLVLDLFHINTNWLWLFWTFSVLDLFLLWHTFTLVALDCLWIAYFIGTYNTTALANFYQEESRQHVGDRSSGYFISLIHPMAKNLWTCQCHFDYVCKGYILHHPHIFYGTYTWTGNYTWTGHFTCFFNFEFLLFTVLSSHTQHNYTHILDTSFFPQHLNPHIILTSQHPLHTNFSTPFILIF